MRIIKALMRFNIELFAAAITGLIYILFDGEEITSILLDTKKRKDFYIVREKIIRQHLEKCARLLKKSE